jgi:tetratricopeptide (TPR) repeat protein
LHFDLGDLFFLVEEGGSAEAKARYEKAYELALRVQQANPGNVQAEHNLSVAYNKLGDVCLRLGESQAARDWYRKGLEVRQRLADLQKDNPQTQRDLFISHIKLGDVSLGLGEIQAARDSYETALKICQGLTTGPTNTEDQRSLSAAYYKLGDAWLGSRDTKRALDCYDRCHAIMQRLANADPTSAVAQRDLSISHQRLGDLHLQRGDRPAALRAYRRALEQFERLAGADSNSALAQRDLALARGKVGKVYLQQGNPKEALDHFQKALEISQRLAGLDRANVEASTDLFVGYWHLGQAEKARFEYAKAAEWFGRAGGVLRPLHQAGKLAGQFKNGVEAADQEVAICRAAAQAVADPASALELPDGLRGTVLSAAISALARKEKQLAKTVAAAELLVANARTPFDLYNAACGFALCVPLADQPATREKYATRAVELLRQAVAKGYNDPVEMQTEADFEALRSRADFRKVVNELETAARPGDRKAP